MLHGDESVFKILFFVTCILTSLPLFPAQEASKELPLVAVTAPAYSTFLSTILDGIAEVHVCVPSGISSHTWEPKPTDTLCMRRAILWFGTGEPFETKLVSALEAQNEPLRYVDLRTCADCIQGCACGHIHGIDPHVWLSPKQLLKQLGLIEEELKKTFPNQAQLIAKRVATLQETLQDLDSYITRTLKPYEGATIVVSHGAYSYFCQDYGIKQLALEQEGKEPTLQELRHIIDEAKQAHVHTIFTQRQYPTRAAKRLSEELHATMKELDPYGPDYFRNMLHITAAIKEEAILQHDDSEQKTAH